jgi:peptidoglycan hydrolase-like protein with peptidoglycan-binding domain
MTTDRINLQDPHALLGVGLSRGDRGAAVAEWQRAIGCTADGIFGPLTERATRIWQAAHGRAPTGEVCAEDWTVAMQRADDNRALWLPASSTRYRVGRYVPPTLIVLHSTEGPICIGAARSIGAWWSQPPKASRGEKPTSAHYVVDAEETVQCVRERDTAYAAGARGNRLGIHVELVGRALSTDWLSGDGLRVFDRGQALCVRIADRHSIPWVALDLDALLAGKRGIVTHATVSAAWHESTHQDPGGPGDKRWPWGEFIG